MGLLTYSIIVYFFGMLMLGTKLCCFCGDHNTSDLLSLIFWFILYPYEIIKEHSNNLKTTEDKNGT